MIILIKNGEIYAPKYLGKKDIILENNKIAGIYENVKISPDMLNFFDVKVINAEGKIIVPGFIDPHVHINGGGGEGSFRTRTPEINISELLSNGITTVVGCLGTDGFCRDGKELFAKAKALDEEGMTTYINTGSYQIPVKTITDSITNDIMLIDKVIGVGEIALSDHRSSQASYFEFKSIVAEAKNAGLLSGKGGITNVHLGDGKRPLHYLFKVLEETEISAKYMIPTHINRNEETFKRSIEYAKVGGNLDITTSNDPEHVLKGERRASDALKDLLDAGVPIERIQFSSDAQGSLPVFNDLGKVIGIGIGSASSLYREVRHAILEHKISIEDAISVVTANTAEHYRMLKKGKLETGNDADIVVIDTKDLNICHVIAKGRVAVFDQKQLIKGTFEK